MAFDAFTKKRLEKILETYIERKIPWHLRDEFKIIYKFRANTISLSQDRPSYMPGQRVELPIAQFRLIEGKWYVYWKDSRDKWHHVEDIELIDDFAKQLEVIDQERYGYMWM